MPSELADSDYSHVEWAWEFCRRNPTYVRRYSAWRRYADERRPPPANTAQLMSYLQKLGPRMARFEPWVNAVLECGGQGSLRLDPLHFWLRKWVDPTLRAREVDTADLFDCSADVELACVHATSAEGCLLLSLGELTSGGIGDLGYTHIQTSDLDVLLRKPEFLAWNGQRISFTLPISIDMSPPLGPKLKQVAALCAAQKATETMAIGPEKASKSHARFHYEVAAHKRQGLADALRVLDAYDKLQDRPSAIRQVANDPTLHVKDRRYQQLAKSLDNAEWMRKVGYKYFALGRGEGSDIHTD